MKSIHVYALSLMSVFHTPCGQKWITRNIIQDRKGNIWMAAFNGIFRRKILYQYYTKSKSGPFFFCWGR